jgi:hypothetical protein
VSKEEKALFRSRRIRKYKLEVKDYSLKRRKAQGKYYQNKKEDLKLKRRERYKKQKANF